MPLGQSYPLRHSIPDTFEVGGVWTGGGAAANMTKATADWNRGIASVNYNAATGKYKVTFVDVGQQIIWASAEVMRPTSGDDPIPANILRGSFSIANKTVEVEFGATLVDIDTDEKVCFRFQFAKNGPDA